MRIIQKYAFILLIIFLAGCENDNKTSVKIITDEVINGKSHVQVEIKHNDLVNPYSVIDELVVNGAEYGLYPQNQIKILRNGTDEKTLDGGYITIYRDTIEIRLYYRSDGSDKVYIQYSGNGSYERR